MVSKGNLPGTLVQKLTLSLLMTVGLLVLALAVNLFMGGFILANQKNLDRQEILIKQDTAELLRSMVDQQNGVRAYLTTTDRTLLQPYEDGRVQYLSVMQDLQNIARNPDLVEMAMVLQTVEERADEWYRNFAQVQLSRVQRGGPELDLARQESTERDNKTRFDGFRTSISRLNQAIDTDMTRLQERSNLLNLSILVGTVLVAIGAVFSIWRVFSSFIARLRVQLGQLMVMSDRLEAGDLSARLPDPNNDELGRLGQNFNAMAGVLERQQKVLEQQDIQDNLLQLNNALNTSLELEPLLEQFLARTLQLLDLQVAAVYLFNPASRLLSLSAAQGLEHSRLEPVFALGEGMIGQTATLRKPVCFEQPPTSALKGFEVKTLVGQVVPATIFNLSLTRGDQLLGVLTTGTLYPMGEKARNVLEVIAGNLAVAISNAMAYRHIQSQADELERRQQELERNNREVSRQRDELAVLNSALEEAGRLRSQFLSTMSHELRTPLTAIIGFSQLSLRGADAARLSERQRQNYDRILKNGQHLLNLVNDVLDIAKIDAGRMELGLQEVAVPQFLNSLIEQTQSLAAEKKLTLNCEVAPEVERFETDPEKLRQILLNLLSNAIKFTEKGEVRLSAAFRPGEPSRHDAAHERIVIVVKDTGIGIPLDKQEHIFEEFFQVDGTSTRRYGGTGLGLSIVRKLTDLLGGQVELESHPGEGSTFTVILPRYPRSNRAPAPDRVISYVSPKPAEPPRLDDAPASSGDKRLILAIDDDPDVVELLHMAFENTSYDVVGLHDLSQLKTKLAELKPFAITLDVMMPESNGWQILQQLKSDPATATIPIIMLSVVSDRSAGYVLGASEYLVKPIDREVLLTTLDRLVPAREPVKLLNADGHSGFTGRIAPARAWSLPEASRQVLIVDDELDTRYLLENLMLEAGYQVRTAAGGLEALQLVAQSAPDVIMLDLMMPDLDGFEVFSRLKANPQTAQVPVIVLTAKTLTQEDYRRLESGANRIIQKGRQPMASLLHELEGLLNQVSHQTPR